MDHDIDGSTAIIVRREGLGCTEPELQRRLFSTYLELLLENEKIPGAMCFMTEGVRLLVEGSELLNGLRRLQQRGTHLIACKTCLDAFGLTDRLAVGIIGGMGDILACQAKAAKVITL